MNTVIKSQGVLTPQVAVGRQGFTSPVKDVRQGEIGDLAVGAVHLTAHHLQVLMQPSHGASHGPV